MTDHITGSFMIDMSSYPEDERMKTLREVLEKLGYKKVKVPLMYSKVKPLQPMKEPIWLKFL